MKFSSFRQLSFIRKRGIVFGIFGSTVTCIAYGVNHYLNRFIYITNKLKTGCIVEKENHNFTFPYCRRPKLEQKLSKVLSPNPTNTFYIINGQNGTGKTRTILELMESRIKSNELENWILYIPIRSPQTFSKDLYFTFNLRLEWYLKNLLSYTKNSILESILNDIEKATKAYNKQTGRLPVIVIDNVERMEENFKENLKILLKKANEWAKTNSVKIVFISNNSYSSSLQLIEKSQDLLQNFGSILTVRDLKFEESFNYLSNAIIVFDENGSEKYKLVMNKKRICEIISLVGGRLAYLERFKKDLLLGIDFEETAQQLIEKENERLLIAYKSSEKWKVMMKLGKSLDGLYLEEVYNEFSNSNTIYGLLSIGIVKLKKSKGRLKLKFDSRLSKRVFEERMINESN